jgi:hypothetical protein
MDCAALAPTRCRRPKQAKARVVWTPEEDDLLTQLVGECATVSWTSLLPRFPNKTASQLAGRWDTVINPRLVKGSWTRAEDEAILSYVREHGERDWARLAGSLSGRTGKQCRERNKNNLDATVNHNSWSEDEDRRLIELHAQYGNAWAVLATFFERRTDNCIKNRWNSTLKKRLERMELGQPLVLKRGRKPKRDTFRKEETPRKETNCEAGMPGIEMLPYNLRMTNKFGVAATKPRLPSIDTLL